MKTPLPVGAAESLLHLATHKLRRPAWSVYYLATYPDADAICLHEASTGLDVQPALELLQTLPTKEWFRVPHARKRRVIPTPQAPYRQRRDEHIFRQYVDGQLTRSCALNYDDDSPFLDGPYIAFGTPHQFFGECETYVVSPDISFRKSQIQYIFRASIMELFRKLDASDESTFRQWAHEHYEPFSVISGTWHPVIQDECRRMNEHAGSNVSTS